MNITFLLYHWVDGLDSLVGPYHDIPVVVQVVRQTTTTTTVITIIIIHWNCYYRLNTYVTIHLMGHTCKCRVGPEFYNVGPDIHCKRYKNMRVARILITIIIIISIIRTPTEMMIVHRTQYRWILGVKVLVPWVELLPPMPVDNTTIDINH